MPTISNSTFLDLTSYGTTTATTVEAAYHVPGTPAFQDINVAFILPRANDPTALLTSNWATRQTTLQELKDNGTLWSTYGATTSDYNNARFDPVGPRHDHRQPDRCAPTATSPRRNRGPSG